MAAVVNASINLLDIPKDRLKTVVKKNGEKATYAKISIAINDEARYGNNCSVYMAQTKEERESKIDRQYIGNGRVGWTDGKVFKYEEEDLSMKPAQIYDLTSVDEGRPF